MNSKNKLNIFFKFLGGFGIFVVMVASIPQIRKMIKTKRTDDVSRTSLILLLIGTLMLQTYAGYFRLWEVFIPNIFTLITLMVQIGLKRCFDTRIMPLGILDQQILDFQNSEPLSQELDLDEGLAK